MDGVSAVRGKNAIVAHFLSSFFFFVLTWSCPLLFCVSAWSS